ncbi:hypothetical protein L2750_09090 [Shewanella submarina]|uniref:DUF4870 family protein n=1 Tax=Shewanella submarina TaxID=2016376 RepID=A0ABV7GAH5_9GAMM|nr:hypothetical protein [Shewanella submarina]MCL1037309.1 hypothetical protein [Shewanella submarina]
MTQEYTEVNRDTGEGNAKIVYLLYLVGLFIGVTGIVGVVLAYVNRSEADDWVQTHYQYQIRTFWIGLLMMFVGTVLALVLIGYLIWMFWLVWLIVRCIKGFQALDKKQPIDNPTTWLF